MKKALFLPLLALVLISASPLKNVSPELKTTTETALSKVSKERAKEFTDALGSVNKKYRDGMAFLISYMPEKDLKNMDISILKEAVNFGYKAREEFPWCRELPQDIFFNDVLPYASMDETRELWREEFYNTFKPIVAGCRTAREAQDTLNKVIEKVLDVKYNTKRKKPNQSPHESMEQHMASCSGLSILLTDALRSVGIPSRVAGTPLWVSREGNHNWSEVWLDGTWYFTEYNPDKLDHSWFLPRAAAADTTTNPIYQVYATSFKPTENNQNFIMVWNWRDKTVPGVIVTDRYVRVYKEQQKEASIQKGFIPVVIKAYKKGGNISHSDDRVAVEVKVTRQGGKRPLASGTTANQTADMNNYLTVYLPANGTFTVTYGNQQNEIKTGDAASSEPVILWVE